MSRCSNLAPLAAVTTAGLLFTLLTAATAQRVDARGEPGASGRRPDPGGPLGARRTPPGGPVRGRVAPVTQGNALGFSIETRAVQGFTRHYVAAIRYPRIATVLGISVNDELLWLNCEALVGRNHTYAVNLFRDLQNNDIQLAYRRTMPTGGAQHAYSLVTGNKDTLLRLRSPTTRTRPIGRPTRPPLGLQPRARGGVGRPTVQPRARGGVGRPTVQPRARGGVAQAGARGTVGGLGRTAVQSRIRGAAGRTAVRSRIPGPIGGGVQPGPRGQPGRPGEPGGPAGPPDKTGMTKMTKRMAAAEVFLPLVDSNVNQVHVKSVGDPTKFIKGNSRSLFLGALTQSAMANEKLDLHYYLMLSDQPPAFLVAIRLSDLSVYLEVEGTRVTTKVGGVNQANPPKEVLFHHLPTTSSHVLVFAPLRANGYYLSTNGTSNFYLSTDRLNPRSMFEVLRPPPPPGRGDKEGNGGEKGRPGPPGPDARTPTSCIKI